MNSSFNIFTFARERKKPLLLDGASGSYFQQKGLITDQLLWSSLLNIDAPEEVYTLHAKYIKAGADIITTNTFRTNPNAIKLSSKSIECEKLVKAGVEIALSAAKSGNVLIAGSNAPAEDCYHVQRTIAKKELEYNHHKHIDLLMVNGCDFILNETQSHLDEVIIISKYCSKNKIPYIMSIFFDEKFKILSGERIGQVLKIIDEYAPVSISFNCIPPLLFKEYIKNKSIKYNWGAYFNYGKGNYSDKLIECGIKPVEYISQISFLIKKNPSFIGSCCGSNPSHTKKIREFIDEIN